MQKDRVKQLEDILNLGLGLQILLHLYLNVLNFINGIDKGYGHSYPVQSYVLIGVYLLIVLTTDLFMIRHRKFEPSKVLSRYWGSAFVAEVLVLLLHTVAPEVGDVIKAFCLFYTPFVVLAPFLEVLGAPVYGDASLFSLAAIGAFCLFNWAVCKFAVRTQ